MIFIDFIENLKEIFKKKINNEQSKKNKNPDLQILLRSILARPSRPYVLKGPYVKQ